MRVTFAVALLAAASAAEAGSPGPSSPVSSRPIPAPQDRAYPGVMRLEVDATDVERRIVRVHETLSGVSGDTVLLYPKWLPGTHAPEGPIDRLSGITIKAQGTPLAWARDTVDVFAFRVPVPRATQSLDIDFEYLSPTTADVGSVEISRRVQQLEWNELVLYPAGYYARQIPVQATLTLPNGWQFASALEPAGSTGARTDFKRVSLETLIDSPAYAGLFMERFDLDPGAAAAVHLNVFAERPELLAVKPDHLKAYRSLVQQAYRLFGSHHYDHYDFLFALTDEIEHSGLEHHQSSENGSDPQTYTEWDDTPYDRDLLAHEYTHSWNGKFRRPADLWTPNFNVPMQNSLLWVYEGQTEYWGDVLAARSGLRTRQQTLDKFALLAAYYQSITGGRWRSAQDTTNDEIINPRRPMSWEDRQRFEDYYDIGKLVWLEADTIIRERSGGRRSLDDFARAFFGINDGSFVPVTYVFEDVVRALNAVEPYDWATFLRERFTAVDQPAPLEGIRRGGYRLTFTDTPSDYDKAIQAQRKRSDLWYSIGVTIDQGEKPGSLMKVLWDSPAFKSGLTRGSEILAVNGYAYSIARLRDAIQAARATQLPIELIIKNGDAFSIVKLDYHGGLRYPHLERDPAQPPRLDDVLAERR